MERRAELVYVLLFSAGILVAEGISSSVAGESGVGGRAAQPIWSAKASRSDARGFCFARASTIILRSSLISIPLPTPLQESVRTENPPAHPLPRPELLHAGSWRPPPASGNPLSCVPLSRP